MKKMPEELANAEPSDWIAKMQQYFQETGAYRAEDLLRLLGNPAAGVTISSNPVEMKKQLDRMGAASRNYC